VGADRKGPLAAFVVIAIIAAILLVTSVRSQAAPVPDQLPASVVAAPPAPDVHLWVSVTSRVHEIVQDGVVLGRKATSEPSDDQDATVAFASSTTGSTPDRSGQATHPTVAPHRHHTAPAHHGHAVRDSDQPSDASGSSGHGHGRHLGWSHGNGHHHGHGHGLG
jgi:hypothetical protein